MPEHDVDEYGDHDADACYQCLRGKEVKSDCRCGQCCHLIIEVRTEDAEIEPRIREKGTPLLDEPDENGTRELIGYALNSARNDYACAFLDRETNLCGIYDTRPLICRLFDCTGEDREQLVELGLLPPR